MYGTQICSDVFPQMCSKSLHRRTRHGPRNPDVGGPLRELRPWSMRRPFRLTPSEFLWFRAKSRVGRIEEPKKKNTDREILSVKCDAWNRNERSAFQVGALSSLGLRQGCCRRDGVSGAGFCLTADTAGKRHISAGRSFRGGSLDKLLSRVVCERGHRQKITR